MKNGNSFFQLGLTVGYQIKVWNAGGCVLGYQFRIGDNETAWSNLISGQTVLSDKFYRLDQQIAVKVDAAGCGHTHCYGPKRMKQVN